jgi:hypothetical protein
MIGASLGEWCWRVIARLKIEGLECTTRELTKEAFRPKITMQDTIALIFTTKTLPNGTVE